MVRTPSGDSSAHQLARGFRKGCPSRCVFFNVMHNLVSQSLKRQFKEPGNRFDAVGSSGHCESKSLGVVSFADDTTGSPTSQQSLTRSARWVTWLTQRTSNASAAHSQAAHLITACWTLAVRFLGHDIDADGSTERTPNNVLLQRVRSGGN